ncbi:MULTISPECIES: HDOD domain-containing protein [Pseudoalteromonas]|uniref:HDOD domain-containing protein n=1 Tax=Pseudoalteromonas TaxID=53246 RepID=UPI000C7BD5A2|nr:MULTISPECIES: HDOD domain-containing protein [unclassified Pseudoalteromonas]AUJ71085.1 HDOD domain protein [Pseudoalteromonas sp. NC201]MCF2828182.1 HDOD domain-containing protein [Pseudoalteromonas sp. OF5H-5]MCF2832471.1 HDOD domain-containing protein [Pseudoalteromonas sp. DL2-H6]MCF2924270.1 HDOD domain-containing protein [Pseudoalteromonas sp. DL2-H1]MCX2766677.1 HDOD domain-containing protein [Pseudoalteromonas sp. B530]
MIDIDDKVLNDLRGGFNLPAKPEILQALQNELSQPEPELFTVAEIIAADVGASAAVLKVINSPAYGLARTITDIKQAVMFLGVNCITQLVTGYLLKNAFEQSKCCISLQQFWDNAADISKAAMVVGHHLKASLPMENLQLLGLFHDAGIPAMAVKYPDYAEVIKQSIERPEQTLIYYEQQKYPVPHTVIGYFLATSWHLPKEICQMILRHHDVSYLEEQKDAQHVQTFAALKLAENLCFEAKHFRSAADWYLFKDKVMIELNLHEDEYQNLKDDVDEVFIG